MSDLQLPVQESFNRREREILHLIKEGLSNHAIAQKLCLSLETIKWYNRQIFDKLAVDSRTQAIKKAIELGLIEAWAGNPDRARDLPPPAAHPNHNLPTALTTFIGRKKEVETLKQLILTESNRLVTVTGVGGVGKTRLAQQVGWELLEVFPDGVFFVSLADTIESDLVISAIAATFNLHETPRHSLAEKLQEYLVQRSLLLILDNFEQVLNAGPHICSLLTSCRSLKILTTSREILRLTGEHVFFLHPFPLPDEQLSWKDVLESDPVQLFVQRAYAFQPDFHLTEENILTVVEICRKLEGLPLGIELAAARARIFNPKSILAQLDNRLQMLAGGGRNMPLRQQSLRASIEWSYHLLTPSEQILLQRLAVFTGGGSLEAVEAICVESGIEIMKDIDSLLDKQLILCSDLDGEPRFKLYEIIREFSLEYLEQIGESFETRRRYANYYADLLERFFYELDRLELEIENFRAVLRWVIESGQAEPGLRIINHPWFWSQRNNEWHYWLDQLLCLPGAQAVPQLRLHGIFSAFLQGLFQDDHIRCENMLHKHLALAKELEDQTERIASLYLCGYFLILSGDYDEAVNSFKEGLKISEQLETTAWVAYSNWGLGDCYLLLEDYDKAEIALQTALDLFTKLGFRFQRIETLTCLGTIALEKKAYNSAIQLFQQSLEEAIKFGVKSGFADCLNGLAAVAQQNGNYFRSACLYGAAFEMGKITGSLSHEPPLKIISQRYQDALSQQMDQADLNRAWQEGLSLTVDEAIEYSLENRCPLSEK